MGTAPNPTPTVDDVAALIRARTKDNNGNELGTFTADTRPTEDQAQQAIDHQVTLLHSQVGYIGAECDEVATMAAAYGAAAEIELSYFPEQARREMSPYSFLIARYGEIMAGLVACVSGDLPDSPGGGDLDLGEYRFGTFDAVSGTVQAYYTGQRWPPVRLPSPPIDPPVDPDPGP